MMNLHSVFMMERACSLIIITNMHNLILIYKMLPEVMRILPV